MFGVGVFLRNVGMGMHSKNMDFSGRRISSARSEVMAEDIVYSRVPSNRFQDVITHLRCSFFADEPLNKSVSLCVPGQPHAELEAYSLSVLSQQLSIMATHGDEVVGACLAGNPFRDIHSEYHDPKLKKIFDFIGDMDKEAHYDHGVPEEKILDLKIISVDDKMRGLRIGSTLYETVEALAKEEGFQLFRTQATSLFTQKMLDKFGWETAKEIKYSEYPSPELNYFNVDHPHETFKIMVKLLY